MRADKQVAFLYLAKLFMNIGDVLFVILVLDKLSVFDECRIYPSDTMNGIAMIVLAYIVSFAFNSFGLKQEKR